MTTWAGSRTGIDQGIVHFTIPAASGLRRRDISAGIRTCEGLLAVAAAELEILDSVATDLSNEVEHRTYEAGRGLVTQRPGPEEYSFPIRALHYGSPLEVYLAITTGIQTVAALTTLAVALRDRGRELDNLSGRRATSFKEHEQATELENLAPKARRKMKIRKVDLMGWARIETIDVVEEWDLPR